MSAPINLSFVLTTFNKLPYLRVTLPLLIAACRPDQEIVVVDGGSTDGTREFLQSLFDNGKIHQFVSEKDFGEAHGTNKAIFLARGELIKIITDDDVFDFNEINRCKDFMLRNPSMDVLGFDGFGFNMSLRESGFTNTKFISGFREWQKSAKPFLFCGLSLLIRKSSLSYLGLLNPLFMIVDMEYSMRISSLKSNIAFYTGLAFVNIVGPASNSVRFNQKIEQERKRVNKMYNNRVSIKKSLNVHFPFGKIRRLISRTSSATTTTLDDYASVVSKSVSIMKEFNDSHKGEFLTNLR